MNEKLNIFVKAAFTPYQKHAILSEMKEDVLYNLQDKHDALKAKGKSDDETYKETINSLGDIGEFVTEQSNAASRSK